MLIRKIILRSSSVLVIAVIAPSRAHAPALDEYVVKAAFVYNFAKFVEWPPQTFKTDKDPIRICILGEDPFGTDLNETVAGKTVLGRGLTVTKISDLTQAAVCQMLFVSSSERHRLPAIFASVRKGVLTIGETEGFGAQGGIVNFKVEAGHVRLEINAEAATSAKLRISSQVLNLAQIVKPAVRK